MPTPTPTPVPAHRAVVVHAADAEVLDGPSPMRLLADSDAFGGALSVSSGRIAAGTALAKPHLHVRSWEVFHVLDGALEMLLDEEVVTVGRGGLVAVPPGVVHAFGAAPDGPAELLVLITPGVRRFDYFRALPRVLRGELAPEELAGMQEVYDVHFRESPLWERTLAARRAAGPRVREA
ncbi:cupin domain-containing protein [Streptomyces sp. NPDC048603]|uniref:cupin domain-containing protein n=1 Tax=Streptomyces sp. NPDC048603 TaxID=3365577 RepID=UPI003720E331